MCVRLVRERIRTPDTLVRSQVLYPAELHAHALTTSDMILQNILNVKKKKEKLASEMKKILKLPMFWFIIMQYSNW